MPRAWLAQNLREQWSKSFRTLDDLKKVSSLTFTRWGERRPKGIPIHAEFNSEQGEIIRFFRGDVKDAIRKNLISLESVTGKAFLQAAQHPDGQFKEFLVQAGAEAGYDDEYFWCRRSADQHFLDQIAEETSGFENGGLEYVDLEENGSSPLHVPLESRPLWSAFLAKKVLQLSEIKRNGRGFRNHTAVFSLVTGETINASVSALDQLHEWAITFGQQNPADNPELNLIKNTLRQAYSL